MCVCVCVCILVCVGACVPLCLYVCVWGGGGGACMCVCMRLEFKIQDSSLLYYLITKIKKWLNINHITVHNNTYCIF